MTFSGTSSSGETGGETTFVSATRKGCDCDDEDNVDVDDDDAVMVGGSIRSLSGGAPPFGGMFLQLRQRQLAPQKTSFWKHSQYFFRQNDLRHLHPH